MSEINFEEMKVGELKSELRMRGLKVGGTKDELIERLEEHYEDPVVASPTPKRRTPKKSPKKKAPKKKAKDHSQPLRKGIRTSDLSLSAALTALLEVYGVSEKLGHLLDLVEDEDLTDTVVPALDVIENYEELNKLRTTDLKKILKERKQKVSGKKEDLIERILNPEEPSKVAELQMPEVNIPSIDNAPVVVLPQVPDPEEQLILEEEEDDDATEEMEEEENTNINLPILPDLGVVGNAVPDLPIVPDAISFSHSGLPTLQVV